MSFFAFHRSSSIALHTQAQRELQAAVDKHIAPELAGIEAAERRLQAALEKVAAQQSGHTHELQRAVEAQDRIDQAELQTYRDTTAARKQRQQHASSRTAFEAAEAVVNRETVQERRAAVVLADVQRKHAAAEEHLRLEQTAVRTAQHATLLANNRQVAAKETTNSEAASKRVLEAEMVVLVSVWIACAPTLLVCSGRSSLSGHHFDVHFAGWPRGSGRAPCSTSRGHKGHRASLSHWCSVFYFVVVDWCRSPLVMVDLQTCRPRQPPPQPVKSPLKRRSAAKERPRSWGAPLC